MGGGWKPSRLQLLCFMILILFSGIQECTSLNQEGLALWEFRSKVDYDPYEAFSNWNYDDAEPCSWLGVHCVDNKVEILDLSSFSLEGVLAPELRELSHLKSLLLSKNRFSGTIPKEFGEFKMLEVLDLRNNNLYGTIPMEIVRIPSLKLLLLCGNDLQGRIPAEIENFNSLSGLQLAEGLTSRSLTGRDCISRKSWHCIWQGPLKQLKIVDRLLITAKGMLQRYLHLSLLFGFENDYIGMKGESCSQALSSSAESFLVNNVQHMANIVRRRLLEESSNLAAGPVTGIPHPSDLLMPITVSSGSFPAATRQSHVPAKRSPSSPSHGSHSGIAVHPPPTHGSPNRNYIYIIGGVTLSLILLALAIIFFVLRNRGEKITSARATGLSGQLQKAFVSGVPKLNRSELEIACEDFSNVIENYSACTLYKGTLSSGVEIAVASTTISSSNDWSNHAEILFRKKIDALSRINHKNLVNLLGYCTEDIPFTRMMVFEYAPNGRLYEHLHVEEVEHLDWNARVRIIMGMAYCIHYMHHEQNPPFVLPNLHSRSVFLTDDYAAKISEMSFWTDIMTNSKVPNEEELEHSSLLNLDSRFNIYTFGMILLEIISGKVPYNEEHRSLEDWAIECLTDKKKISYMIDPTLKAFKNDELDIICCAIVDCMNPDPSKRPTMKEVISKLREVISVSPDAATPKLSPLWWAELEILSVEAS